MVGAVAPDRRVCDCGTKVLFPYGTTVRTCWNCSVIISLGPAACPQIKQTLPALSLAFSVLQAAPHAISLLQGDRLPPDFSVDAPAWVAPTSGGDARPVKVQSSRSPKRRDRSPTAIRAGLEVRHACAVRAAAAQKEVQAVRPDEAADPPSPLTFLTPRKSPESHVSLLFAFGAESGAYVMGGIAPVAEYRILRVSLVASLALNIVMVVYLFQPQWVLVFLGGHSFHVLLGATLVWLLQQGCAGCSRLTQAPRSTGRGANMAETAGHMILRYVAFFVVFYVFFNRYRRSPH